MSSDRLVISEDDLEAVYRTLSDATDAAAAGDPNECASRAADAKDQLVAIHSEADPVERVTDVSTE